MTLWCIQYVTMILSPVVSGIPLAPSCELSGQLTGKESLMVTGFKDTVKSCVLNPQGKIHIINIPDRVNVRSQPHHCRHSVQSYYYTFINLTHTHESQERHGEGGAAWSEAGPERSFWNHLECQHSEQCQSPGE